MGVLRRYAVVLCVCVIPMSVTFGWRRDENGVEVIPYGMKLKTTRPLRREVDQLQVAESQNQQLRFQRGFVYQQPLVLVQPAYVAPTAGYVYPKPTTHGYVYKPPPTTTTTTTTTTTPEPAIEEEQDIDSQFITPAPPPPSFPEREFEQSPVEVEPSADQWDIRDSVPGTPGDDYPVLSAIPKTSFRCEGRIPGYYADPQTKCQVFHRCSDCTDNVRLQMDSFLCPNGTQFNQEVLSCDWWGNVHCETAVQYYAINEELNVLGADGKYLQLSAMRHAPQLLDKKIAPGIIPKEERRPLPAQYRSRHSHDADHRGTDDIPPPPTPQNSIVFNEFRKPIVTSKRTDVPSTTPNNAIESALNNPDYFNPVADTTDDPTSSRDSGVIDDDYLSEGDSLQFRSSIEDFGDTLDNEPLLPLNLKPKPPKPKSAKAPAPLKPTRPRTLTATSKAPARSPSPITTFRTPKPTTTTTTTTPAPTTTTTTVPTTLKTTKPTTRATSTTTPSPESEEDGNDVGALIPFQRQVREDDEASGFIVNKRNLTQRKQDKVVENLENDQRVDRLPAPPTDFQSPPGNGEQDSYLPQTQQPQVSPTYIPPTPKPKLTYAPLAPPNHHFPSPSDYLPPKLTFDSPAPLPVYAGNPYVAPPIQQQVAHPSTFNFVPLTFGNQYTTSHHAQPQHLKIVRAHVPILNFGQFPSAQTPLRSYITPGGYDFSNHAPTNFFANTYFG